METILIPTKFLGQTHKEKPDVPLEQNTDISFWSLFTVYQASLCDIILNCLFCIYLLSLLLNLVCLLAAKINVFNLYLVVIFP